jgi:RNA polymerase sigma-70 factor (ECF subfamily)
MACEALPVGFWTAEARASYDKALALTQQQPERQFLQERIRHLR